MRSGHNRHQPRRKGQRHLVKMTAAPLCSMLAGVTIEDGKVALTSYASVIVNESVGVLHRPAAFAITVLGDAYAEGGSRNERRCGMHVDDLRPRSDKNFPACREGERTHTPRVFSLSDLDGPGPRVGRGRTRAGGCSSFMYLSLSMLSGFWVDAVGRERRLRRVARRCRLSFGHACSDGPERNSSAVQTQQRAEQLTFEVRTGRASERVDDAVRPKEVKGKRGLLLFRALVLPACSLSLPLLLAWTL